MKAIFGKIVWMSCLVVGALGAVGCSLSGDPTSSPSTPVPADATETATPPTPTATPLPLAATVNGDGILLEDLELQTRLAKEADSTLSDADARRQALDSLIEETLLASVAKADGYVLDEAGYETRVQGMGGMEAVTAWQQKFGFSPEAFQRTLERSAAAAWQRDQIISAVPSSAEQVHARQVLVLTREAAETVVLQANSGADFATLALNNDPQTSGDMGWFPRGYLTQKAVEDAAFKLQPGEISDIVETSFGYHIIQVIEREADRPLSNEARLALQRKALEEWFTTQRNGAAINAMVQ